MLLANRPVNVRTLREPEILILDSDQLGNDFMLVSERPRSRVGEPDRVAFSV